MEKKIVIGITGPTRCGKGRLVTMLTRLLEQERGWNTSNGDIEVIGQDAFWRHEVMVVLPNGQEVTSEEEAGCHDFMGLQSSMQAALAKEHVLVVIVEGFTIIHDENIAQCCDHIFLLDVSRENTILRRSAQHPHNPNYLPVEDCEHVVWPAHERYLAHADEVLAKVGKTWTKLDANDNGADMLDSHVRARAELVFKTCFPVPPTGVPLDVGYMYLESHLNGLVLDIDEAIETHGAKLVMWGKEGGKNQKWRLTPEGYLESALNGFVLTVQDQELVMWPREGGDHQFWRLTDEGYLESAFCQGRVLDIDLAKEHPGAKLIMWEKADSSNQKWRRT